MSSRFESIADLAATAAEDDPDTADEVKVYRDEGDGGDKSPENLTEDKEGLVDQSEEPLNDDVKPIGTEFNSEGKNTEAEAHPIVTYVPALYNGVQIGVLPTLANSGSAATSLGFGINLPNLGVTSSSEGSRPSLPAASNLGSLCTDLPQWPPGSYFPMTGTLSDPLAQRFRFPPMMSGFGAPPIVPVPSCLPPLTSTGLYATSTSYPFSLADQLRPWNLISESKPQKPHIKKPLNAFMLFMKEQRGNVVSECTLKESAAINQILGRKWHELSREEQAKYYEMARQERLKHMELYPGWSARDNYGIRKKRRKKRERLPGESGELARKCRARYGVNQIDLWCKLCRRKKKCGRFQSSDETTSLGADEAASTMTGTIDEIKADPPTSEEYPEDNKNLAV